MDLARLAPLLFAFALAACADFPENPPLEAYDLDGGYRFGALSLGPENTDNTFVILTLSGGGTRAAALAHGVMQALEDTKLATTQGSLLDEVDVISSVSGGSFAAAHYALNDKERFLADFPEEVLHRPVQRDLLLRLLAPWNWPRLLSWSYGRSDLADEYYGKHVFGPSRYRHLRRQRPFIVLNATDVGRGIRFAFIQDHFDRLCSDLDDIKVSRAVTASSAFPIAFPPLTFRNHPKKCGYGPEDWPIRPVERDLERNPMRYDRATDWASYAAPSRPYIHLSDGGLADNIGLRGPMLSVTWLESPVGLISLMNEGRVDRVVFVIVDAKPEGESKLDRSAHPPSFVSVLHAASTGPMEHYSSDTVQMARSVIDRWSIEKGAMDHMRAKCEQFASELCEESDEATACRTEKTAACFKRFRVIDPADDPAGRVVFHRIHVRFAAEKDPDLRSRLNGIGTALQLPRAEVKLLTEAGARLLRTSPGYACLRHAIGADPPDSPGRCPEPRAVPD